MPPVAVRGHRGPSLARTCVRLPYHARGVEVERGILLCALQFPRAQVSVFVAGLKSCAAVISRRGKDAALASSRPDPGTHGQVDVPSVECASPVQRRWTIRDAIVVDSGRRAPSSVVLHVLPPA